MSNIKRVLEEREDLLELSKLQDAYIKYLRNWYSEHCTDDLEPMDFPEFCKGDNDGDWLY
jgi:hypothetical protein